MNKENLPEYLYIYRESNTVIQIHLNENKTAYILDDGEWEDKADLDSNEFNNQEIERLMNGARYVEFDSEKGDFWTVYISADAAFGLNC